MAYGYKKRYGGSRRYKRYGKSRRFKKSRRFGRKMKVPGGMKLVPAATYRSAGSYGVGQNAGHELKYIDSCLYNAKPTAGGGAYEWAVQSRSAAPAGGPGQQNPSGTQTDGTITLFTCDATQPGMVLNIINSGTDACQRLGRKVNPRSFMLRVGAQIDDSAVATPTGSNPVGSEQTVRVVVVLDKQPNGQIAVAGDVFMDPTQLANTGAGPNDRLLYTASSSFMQLNNRDRFVVLADEKVNLSVYGHSHHQFEIRRNINLETIYSASVGNNSTPAQISSGTILVFFLGDEYANTGAAAPFSPNPAVAYATSASARVRYYDA